MYLKVQIPYSYSLSKSASDPTQWEVLPHRSKNGNTHHIFCDLLSYQTPWSQFNTKGEIYEIDNAHTLYPAFCKTTKIRPKMLPSSGKINLFSLEKLGGLRKYGPKRELLISNGTPNYSTWKTQDNETAENEYYSALQTIPANIYSKVYEKFFTTRTKPVHKFMEWVSTQKDILGVWNANSISSGLLHDRGGVNYRYSNYQAFGSKQVGSPTPRKITSKPYLQAMIGRPDEFTDNADYSSLVVDYDQKMWGCVPYESHPEFNLPRQAVPTNIGYETDIQEKKIEMAHGDVGSYRLRQTPRSTDFAPPILEWEAVGFPKVSPVSTKALYARKPIHLQFVYRETGFVSRKKINSSDSDSMLNQIISHSVNYADWFKRLALPVDTSQDQVSNYRVIEGSVRAVSSMSHNTVKFSEGLFEPLLGEQVSYESTGNAYCFSIASHFSGANRNIHFPRGDYTTVNGKIISEKDTPFPHSVYPELGNRYYHTQQKYFPLQGSSASTQEGRVSNINRLINYRPSLGKLAYQKVAQDYTPVEQYEMLDDSVTYPRLIYSAKTQAYDSRPLVSRGTSGGESTLRTASIRPLDVLDHDQDLEGMKILNKIMLENLIPNETIFSDAGKGQEKTQGHDSSLLIPFTRLVHMINLAQKGMASDYTPIKVEAVPVKVGQAVKLTQNLSLAGTATDFTDSFSGSGVLSRLSLAQQNLLVAFVKTIENTRTITGDDIPLEYSVTLYINPKNDLSVLVDYPSILMRDMARGRWRDSLVPAFRITDLVDILTDNANSKYIFSNESSPYFLILPEGRYGAKEGVITLCNSDKYREMTQTSGDWGDDLGYITRPFTLNTVFNDYCYHTIHIKSGMTVSDPVNTLPLDLKRNKLTVKRPFTYTSIFPVTGELQNIELSLTQITRPINDDGTRPTSFGYSPVAYYSVPKDSEEMPDNIPQNVFKPMNTTGRTFKGQRNRSYGDMVKAKDYTTYSSIVLPFENIIPALKEGESNSSGIELFSEIVDNNPKTPILMPYFKEQRNQDARSEGKGRYRYLSDNLSSWSLGVPAEFVPETYTLTGMELGLFNWPLGLV